jgi:hypothetical protein
LPRARQVLPSLVHDAHAAWSLTPLVRMKVSTCSCAAASPPSASKIFAISCAARPRYRSYSILNLVVRLRIANVKPLALRLLRAAERSSSPQTFDPKNPR